MCAMGIVGLMERHAQNYRGVPLCNTVQTLNFQFSIEAKLVSNFLKEMIFNICAKSNFFMK
jgi:hypothetical protein